MLYFHEMFHAEQGHRCAAQELIALHVDLQVRKTAPWPAEVLARLQDGVRAREGMPMPEGVGRRITMPAPK
jgi:acyl-CoA thioester hydrolase